MRGARQAGQRALQRAITAAGRGGPVAAARPDGGLGTRADRRARAPAEDLDEGAISPGGGSLVVSVHGLPKFTVGHPTWGAVYGHPVWEV